MLQPRFDIFRDLGLQEPALAQRCDFAHGGVQRRLEFSHASQLGLGRRMPRTQLDELLVQLAADAADDQLQHKSTNAHERVAWLHSADESNK
jgi:hypothetical protein